MNNLFELLNAPTSLNPRDLATHIRMQVTLSEEVRNNCSRELSQAGMRMTQELATCRFSRKMPKTDDPDYAEFCEELADMQSVVPIPYKYFSSEYNLMKTEADPRKAVDALKDPWRMQAYAAQYLRFAVNAERDQPDLVAKMWVRAIRQYRKFFEVAKVEDSYTFRYAEDDDARQKCREAWDGFLLHQLEDLSERQKQYIKENNSEAANACLQALGLKEAAEILPHARSLAMENSFDPILKAIRSAPTLEMAAEMYDGCPKVLKNSDRENELLQAMLSAIKSELVRAREEKMPIDLPVKWLKKLKVLQAYESGAVMVRIDAKELYEECTAYLRFAVESEDADILMCACELCTPELFPNDVVIGKSSSETMHRREFAPLLLGCLAEALCKQNGKITESKAKNLAKKLLKVSAAMGRNETCYAAITRSVNYMNSNDTDREIVMAFLREFDGDIPLQDKNCRNVAALRKRMGDDPALKLIRQLSETSCDASGYTVLVKKVISETKKRQNEQFGDETLGAIVRKVILNEFVGCANACRQKPNSTLMDALKAMSLYLGKDTEVPAGGRRLTVGDVMESMKTAENMKCFSRLQEAPTGSSEELRAVQEVIKYASENGNQEADDEHTVRDLAEILLLNTYIGNANGYDGDKTQRKILREIAEWLPEGTELRGADITVREFDNAVEPKRIILKVREGLDAGYVSEKNISALVLFSTSWPDVDLGGGQMLHDIAKNFLHAALVQAANAAQRSTDYFSYEKSYFGKVYAAALMVKGCISSAENGTLKKIVNALNISVDHFPESFSPEYPPFRTRGRHGGSSSGSGKGLFAKLQSLFKRK